MKDQSELDLLIRERLEEIKEVPARDPRMANRARAHFLANAVSVGNVQRHKGWNSIFRKEQFAMNMIVSILVVTTLLFGGGATVNAAQNDLPGEPLYSLKLWSEDVGLRLQTDQETKVEHLMDMAQTRIQEMTQLTAEGKPVPDSVRQQLEQHLQQAFQLCSTMDDATLDRTLLQIRERLQQQDQNMDRLQLHTQSQDTLQLLTQTRAMLRDHLQLAEGGLRDHEMFRNSLQNGQDDPATPPAQEQNRQQNGQPTSVPGGSDVTPAGPNDDPGKETVTPGGPNTDPGVPNTDGDGQNDNGNGANPDPRNNNDGSGNGTGGNGTGSGGNSTGGNRP